MHADYKKNNYLYFTWKKCCELDAIFTITSEIFDNTHDDQDTFPESKHELNYLRSSRDCYDIFLASLSPERPLTSQITNNFFLLFSFPIFYFSIIFVGYKIRASLLTPFVSLGEFLRSAECRLDFQFPRFFRGVTFAGSFLFPRSLLGRSQDDAASDSYYFFRRAQKGD